MDPDLFYALQSSPFITRAPGTLIGLLANQIVLGYPDAGADVFSMAWAARAEGCTPSAVHQAFGGRRGFLTALAREYALRYAAWLGNPDGHGLAVLPRTAAERIGVRMWVALGLVAEREALHGNHGPRDALRHADEDEVRMAMWRLGGAPADVEKVTAALGMVAGVRFSMTRLTCPLSAEAGSAVVRSLLETFARGGARYLLTIE